MSVKGTGTVRTETQANIQTNTSNLISGDDVQEAIVNALDSLSKDTYVDTIPYEVGESVIFDDGVIKKFYLCLSGTTPGESPETAPSKWFDILESGNLNVLTFLNYFYGSKSFDWKLNFTPASIHWSGSQTFGSSIVESGKYIIILINDSLDAEYKYHKIVRYNKGTGRIDTFQITTTNAYSGDYHKLPTVVLTKLETLIVAIEQLPGDGNHNGPIDIFRYTDLDNITDNPSPVATVGDNSTMRLAYPALYEMSNGDLFLEARRRYSTSDYSRRVYVKSTDDGATWGTETEYVNYGTTHWMYTKTVQNNLKDRDNVILAMSPGYDSTYGMTYKGFVFLKTSDFTNFYTLDDIDLGSSVDSTEMDANLSWGVAGTSEDLYYSGDLKIIDNEIIFLGQIGTRNSEGTSITHLQVVKINVYDGTVTLGPEFTHELTNLGFLKMIPYKLNSGLYFIGLNDSELSVYKTTDDLDDLIKVGVVGDNYHGDYAYNLYCEKLLGYYNEDTLSIELYKL